jgi:hypothetical protein
VQEVLDQGRLGEPFLIFPTERIRSGNNRIASGDPRLSVEERYANGVAARLPDLARELIQLKVQVLVVDGGTSVRAARKELEDPMARDGVHFTVVTEADGSFNRKAA